MHYFELHILGGQTSSDSLSVQNTMVSFPLFPQTSRLTSQHSADIPSSPLHPVFPFPRGLELYRSRLEWRFAPTPAWQARAPGAVAAQSNGPFCPVGGRRSGSAGAGGEARAGGGLVRARWGCEPSGRRRGPSLVTSDSWSWGWGSSPVCN